MRKIGYSKLQIQEYSIFYVDVIPAYKTIDIYTSMGNET